MKKKNQKLELTEAIAKVNVGAVVICPICKTDNLEDISPCQNNGIYGSGFASWKTMELRRCPNCKIVIKP